MKAAALGSRIAAVAILLIASSTPGVALGAGWESLGPHRSALQARGSCRSFVGVDFAGPVLDLSNVPTASSAEECCKMCEENEGCKAWTRVPKNENCFLKSAASDAMVCQDCEAGINEGRVGAEELGTLSESAKERGLEMFSTGMQEVLNERTDSLVGSRRLQQSFSGKCKMKAGVDLPNNNPINDGKKEITASPQECCDKCRDTLGCASWVYIGIATRTHPKGACWMKAAEPDETPCAVCTSGIVPAEERKDAGQELYNPLPGIDFKGEDIDLKNAPVTESNYECHGICLSNPDCKTWTRTDPDGKCFLKNGVPTIAICPICYSGIIPTRATKEEMEPLVELLQDLQSENSPESLRKTLLQLICLLNGRMCPPTKSPNCPFNGTECP